MIVAAGLESWYCSIVVNETYRPRFILAAIFAWFLAITYVADIVAAFML
ncbi:hypothetical protein AB6A40_010375 [Gnathostoma spinigerum]|uniref:Uncharacterized protein n=1 Tax=Gnathostoma spinigerum TaxID=75299 RepID=A0ABD6F108_9BILA